MKQLTTIFFHQITTLYPRTNNAPTPTSTAATNFCCTSHKKPGGLPTEFIFPELCTANEFTDLLPPRGQSQPHMFPDQPPFYNPSAHVCCTSPAALENRDAGLQRSCINSRPTTARDSLCCFLLHVVCMADTFKSLDHTTRRKPRRRWPAGLQLHDAAGCRSRLATNISTANSLVGDGSGVVI